MLGIRMKSLKVPLWKKIILGICIAEAMLVLLFPLCALLYEMHYAQLSPFCWFAVLPMAVGVPFSFSYWKALKGIENFTQSFKLTLKPVIPFVVSIPLFVIPCCLCTDLLRSVLLCDAAFASLGLPVFLEIMLIIYFCFKREKLTKETIEFVPQFESIQDKVYEVQSSFKVNKIGIIICMVVTMLMGTWPYLWYTHEKAVNEAFGYENLDSFNLIGEFMAKLYMPLMLAIPLAFIYLSCLKGIKTKRNVILIALAPFAPWLLIEGVLCVISLGFFFLIQLAVIVPLLFQIFMTTVCLYNGCYENPKTKAISIASWLGYLFSIVLSSVGIYFIAFSH